MDTTRLPLEFKEFLSLLNSNSVEYLLVGGYAVGAHGYVRATGDIDFWVRVSPQNADKLVTVFQEFGFGSLGLTSETFLNPVGVVRIGISPLKIEILNAVSGLQFDQCYAHRTEAAISGVVVPLISLEDLRLNKKASGRLKDLNDLEHLPKTP